MEHRVQLNRILLLLMMTVCVTQSTSIVLSKYKKIQTSLNITGTVEAQHTIKSSQECAVRLVESSYMINSSIGAFDFRTE